TLPDHCGLPGSVVPYNDVIRAMGRFRLENSSQFFDNILAVNHHFPRNIRFWTGTVFKGIKENPLISAVIPVGEAEVDDNSSTDHDQPIYNLPNGLEMSRYKSEHTV
ncbi:6584_t:CDS:1, partial [Funneliformis geosporum]